MSEDGPGSTIGKGGAPAEDDSSRGHDGRTGDAAMKGGSPPRAGRGGTSNDDEGAIDLESVRDRAS